MGLHFTGEVPFATVHLTGLVRDAEGQKMSKTKGNVIDPSELIEEYGADALRFTLASLDSPGRDIPLEQGPDRRLPRLRQQDLERRALRAVAGGRRPGRRRRSTATGLAAPERWILSRLSRVAAEVEPRFAAFRFDEACNRLYHFFWDDLCDWYIELSKPALWSATRRAPRVGEVLLTVLDRALRLLHPVMPFLTEEIWQRLPGHEAIHPETICLAPYPEREPAWESPEVEAGMDALIQVVTRVRALRTELGLAPKAKHRAVHLARTPASVRLLARAGAAAALPLPRRTVIAWAAPPEGARARRRRRRRDRGQGATKQELGDEERGAARKELREARRRHRARRGAARATQPSWPRRRPRWSKAATPAWPRCANGRPPCAPAWACPEARERRHGFRALHGGLRARREGPATPDWPRPREPRRAAAASTRPTPSPAPSSPSTRTRPDAPHR